ncbi:MAG: WbqC family protein [Flavitalea sp.]
MKFLIDSQYFAPVIYYSDVIEYSYCKIEQYDAFRKMSFRNRCIIAGGNGPINLTVPVMGGRDQKTIIREVKIDNSADWKSRHWKTIESAYNKSPWFEHFRNELFLMYTKKSDWLVDWNMECLLWTTDKLSITTSISTTGSYIKNYPPEELTDHRNLYLPSTINTLFPEPKRYPQVFEDRLGFLPNLSILDRLFCMGTSPI